jgi:hypothetical protein
VFSQKSLESVENKGKLCEKERKERAKSPQECVNKGVGRFNILSSMEAGGTESKAALTVTGPRPPMVSYVWQGKRLGSFWAQTQSSEEGADPKNIGQRR